MFFAKNKIKRSEFKLIEKVKPFNLNSDSFYLNIYNYPDLFKYPKIAFSCSKKVSNSAVVRNKLRRRGYSVLRDFVDNIKNGYFLHFSYKKNSINKSFKDLKIEISQVLELSKVLN